MYIRPFNNDSKDKIFLFIYFNNDNQRQIKYNKSNGLKTNN